MCSVTKQVKKWFHEKTCVFAQNAIVFTVGEAFSLSRIRFNLPKCGVKLESITAGSGAPRSESELP